MLYRFTVASEGVLHATVSDDSGIDIDLHVMTATDGTGCLARDDSEVEVTLTPGEYWLSLDTYVGSREFPGPYLLSATFSGELGEPDDGGNGGSGSGGGGNSGSGNGGGGGGSATPGDQPGQVVALDESGGCSHAPGRTGLLVMLLSVLGLAVRRS